MLMDYGGDDPVECVQPSITVCLKSLLTMDKERPEKPSDKSIFAKARKIP